MTIRVETLTKGNIPLFGKWEITIHTDKIPNVHLIEAWDQMITMYDDNGKIIHAVPFTSNPIISRID